MDNNDTLSSTSKPPYIGGFDVFWVIVFHSLTGSIGNDRLPPKAVVTHFSKTDYLGGATIFLISVLSVYTRLSYFTCLNWQFSFCTDTNFFTIFSICPTVNMADVSSIALSKCNYGSVL